MADFVLNQTGQQVQDAIDQGQALDGLATGAIPKKGANLVEASSMTEGDSDIDVTKTTNFQPNSILIGDLKISDAGTCAEYTYADGTRGVGLVRNLDTNGNRGALTAVSVGASDNLDINLLQNETVSLPIEQTYQTFGYNRTLGFNVIPAAAGDLRIRFWVGTSATGQPFFDETRTFTQAEVDAGVPVSFGAFNAYIFPQGVDLFFRLEGVDMKGGTPTSGQFQGVQIPYFQNTVNPVTDDVIATGTQLRAGPNVSISTNTNDGTITIEAMTGGTTPPQADHTNYIDVTADSNASSVDTGTAVTSDDLNPSVTLETFSTNSYIQILQSQAHTAFTSILLSGINQIGAFTINENARTIGAQAYRQYVTTNLITDAFSGAIITMGGAT